MKLSGADKPYPNTIAVLRRSFPFIRPPPRSKMPERLPLPKGPDRAAYTLRGFFPSSQARILAIKGSKWHHLRGSALPGKPMDKMHPGFGKRGIATAVESLYSWISDFAVPDNGANPRNVVSMKKWPIDVLVATCFSRC